MGVGSGGKVLGRGSRKIEQEGGVEKPIWGEGVKWRGVEIKLKVEI